MLGWMRRKGKSAARPETERGLIYAGSAAPETTTKHQEPGDIHHTFETDRGPLEMRDTAMVLAAPDGSITVPYHQVDAWDDSGKEFRVWWNVAGPEPHHYTMACVPHLPPAAISEELRRIIHQNTFEE